MTLLLQYRLVSSGDPYSLLTFYLQSVDPCYFNMDYGQVKKSLVDCVFRVAMMPVMFDFPFNVVPCQYRLIS